MENIKVRVKDGKLVGEAPTGLAEGTELELSLADAGDDLTEEELSRLNQALEAAWRSVESGRFRPVQEAISELRSGK